MLFFCCVVLFVFFQAEDGIRDLVRSRGLGDVYKRQGPRTVGYGVSLFFPALSLLTLPHKSTDRTIYQQDDPQWDTESGDLRIEEVGEQDQAAGHRIDHAHY